MQQVWVFRTRWVAAGQQPLDKWRVTTHTLGALVVGWEGPPHRGTCSEVPGSRCMAVDQSAGACLLHAAHNERYDCRSRGVRPKDWLRPHGHEGPWRLCCGWCMVVVCLSRGRRPSQSPLQPEMLGPCASHSATLANGCLPTSQI